MPKKSFRDPVTGTLQCWGFIDKPGTDIPSEADSYIGQVESDDFELTPKKWRWDGTSWVALPESAEPTI